VFPAIRDQPQVAPEEHPAYDPEVNIHVGMAEIAQRWDRSGDDPILVAAIYNAGGLYDASMPSSRYHNRWHLRSYGTHLDRAARWYADACAVVGELRRNPDGSLAPDDSGVGAP
jgi:peptidoglycan L-alanyl-D-glutamate endopeptidase CwlK